MKLLRALNSAQAEYQIALAFAFGVLSGVLPFFSLINLFILFIVFTINIPIGLYFIFAAIFSLIASLFDPLLHNFGLSLLNDTALNSFWTTLYNSPLALWLNFNHTITLGGFVVGIVLFIPLFFISKIFIKKYRDNFHSIFKNIKFLSFLDPYKESNEKVNNGIIRWWGSGIFLALITTIVAFTLIILDPLVKYALESLVSKTDTKLQIDSLNTSISNTQVKLTNVTLSKNDKVNTIDSVMIDLNTNNLFRKKIDIELFSLHNISLDKTLQANEIIKTKPITNDKGTQVQKSSKPTLQQKSSKVQLPSVDSVLEKENLKSINEAKEIKKRLEDIKAKWERISKEKIDINKLSSLKKEYKHDKQIIKNDLKKIKALPKEDYNYLINKYKLDQSGAINFIATYIDKDVAKYLDKALVIYEDLKPYLESDNDPEVIRKKGQWIQFEEINPYPNFALQKLEANILDPNIKRVQITASHIYDTKLDIFIKEMQQKEILLDDKFLLRDNKIDINLISTIKKFQELELQADILFHQTNPLYDGQKMIANILKDIHNFQININAKAHTDKKESMKLSIASDLDKKVKKAFKAQIKQYNEKYKNELKQKLQAKLSRELGGVTANSLDEYENIFKQKAKEKLKKKLENKIEDKLKNKLKSLF
jgi:uncharacterized protein (TIGR03546 family)